MQVQLVGKEVTLPSLTKHCVPMQWRMRAFLVWYTLQWGWALSQSAVTRLRNCLSDFAKQAEQTTLLLCHCSDRQKYDAARCDLTNLPLHFLLKRNTACILLSLPRLDWSQKFVLWFSTAAMGDAEKFLKRSEADSAAQASFDSKKWLWVPHEEEGFKSASVLETKGEMVKVRFDNGKVRLWDVSSSSVLAGNHWTTALSLSGTRARSGQMSANEPTEVRENRGYGRIDLLERCQRFAQLEAALLLRIDLCMYSIVFCSFFLISFGLCACAGDLVLWLHDWCLDIIVTSSIKEKMKTEQWPHRHVCFEQPVSPVPTSSLSLSRTSAGTAPRLDGSCSDLLDEGVDEAENKINVDFAYIIRKPRTSNIRGQRKKLSERHIPPLDGYDLHLFLKTIARHARLVESLKPSWNSHTVDEHPRGQGKGSPARENEL